MSVGVKAQNIFGTTRYMDAGLDTTYVGHDPDEGPVVSSGPTRVRIGVLNSKGNYSGEILRLEPDDAEAFGQGLIALAREARGARLVIPADPQAFEDSKGN